jgi:hypothetical protein
MQWAGSTTVNHWKYTNSKKYKPGTIILYDTFCFLAGLAFTVRSDNTYWLVLTNYHIFYYVHTQYLHTLLHIDFKVHYQIIHFIFSTEKNELTKINQIQPGK